MLRRLSSRARLPATRTVRLQHVRCLSRSLPRGCKQHATGQIGGPQEATGGGQTGLGSRPSGVVEGAFHATFIVDGTDDMWRRPVPNERLPVKVEWNLTPLEVSSWPSGDSGLMGGLNG